MEKASADAERLFAGASKTREFNSGSLDEILTYWQLEGAEDTLEELEDTLLSVDFGPTTAMNILDVVRERCEKGEIKTGAEVKAALKRAIVDILVRANDEPKHFPSELEGVREAVRRGQAGGADFSGDDLRNVLRETVVGMLEGSIAGPDGIADAPAESNNGGQRKLSCVLVCGVNGAGKTTTMGKIANMLVRNGNKVMVVPGDTFRAAAAEQLIEWAQRAGATVSHEGGVRFDRHRGGHRSRVRAGSRHCVMRHQRTPPHRLAADG